MKLKKIQQFTGTGFQSYKKDIVSIFHEIVHIKQSINGDMILYLYDKKEKYAQFRIGYIWKGKDFTSVYHQLYIKLEIIRKLKIKNKFLKN